MTRANRAAASLWGLTSPVSCDSGYVAGGLDSGRLSCSTSPSRSPPFRKSELFVGQQLGSTSSATSSSLPGNSTKGAQFTIIANVPYDTVRQDLVTEFRRFGRVELAMVVCDEASRHPHKEWTSTAGYAFVRFSKRGEAAAAIQAATMGLITIRGTRVRADWARKDSYAKRGRVPAAQGAPTLGPYGIPDGIAMLQDSLSAAGRCPAAQWVLGTSDTPPSGNRPGLFTLEVVSAAMRHASVDCSELSERHPRFKANGNMAAYDALAQALRNSTVTYSRSGEACNDFDGPDSAHYVNAPRMIDRDLDPTGSGTTMSAMMAAEKLCCQLMDLLAADERSNVTESSQTVWRNTEPSAFRGNGQRCGILSPTSRGLLSYALSDVVSPDSFPTDVSPIGKSSTVNVPQRSYSPESLLKLAVSQFPCALQSNAADESALTKTGSSRRSSSLEGEEEEEDAVTDSDLFSRKSFRDSTPTTAPRI